jgi:hypothetical protein
MMRCHQQMAPGYSTEFDHGRWKQIPCNGNEKLANAFIEFLHLSVLMGVKPVTAP